jgi:hypothetical protein
VESPSPERPTSLTRTSCNSVFRQSGMASISRLANRDWMLPTSWSLGRPVNCSQPPNDSLRELRECGESHPPPKHHSHFNTQEHFLQHLVITSNIPVRPQGHMRCAQTASSRSSCSLVESPRNRGLPRSSSPKMHPADHMSTPYVYLVLPSIISGARYLRHTTASHQPSPYYGCVNEAIASKRQREATSVISDSQVVDALVGGGFWCIIN